jgi:isocitrate dehydrogenase kinase/phosphatase
MPAKIKARFLHRHADLLDTAFWRQTQARIRSGEWIHIQPYEGNSRLKG